MMELLETTWTARRSAVLLLVLALAGCGVWPLGKPSDSATPLPGEQMVFAVTTAGGLAPPLEQTLITPALAVYGDGRVFEADHDQYIHGTPYAYVVARVDPNAVATFVAHAEARKVVDPGPISAIRRSPTCRSHPSGCTAPKPRSSSMSTRSPKTSRTTYPGLNDMPGRISGRSSTTRTPCRVTVNASTTRLIGSR